MFEKMQGISDLFEHELKDIYDVEQKLLDALQKLASETRDPAVKAAFESHRRETQEQVKRIERVFAMLQKEPDRGEGCAGIDGLLEEKKSFGRKSPTAEILAIFNLAAAAKTERYEISAYESLIQLARGLQLDDAAALFEQNLSEENAALAKVTGFQQEPPTRARPGAARELR